MSTPVHVVGIGLNGVEGVSSQTRHIVDQATLLVGSDRHLSYFPHHPAQRLSLGDLQTAMSVIQSKLTYLNDLPLNPVAPATIVILVSGDPLFFGLGRLLLQHLPPESLTFHPSLSSIQLAFNRIKQPWQDATLISIHGREMDALIPALKQGKTPIALLTDSNHSPYAIAHLIHSLNVTTRYHIWICENLGGNDESVQRFTVEELLQQGADISFALLNVVILVQDQGLLEPEVSSMPLLGIEDRKFASFSDRPGLMTKREIRTLIVAELVLNPHQIIWDVGAGTGSVSIEIARLNPTAKIYAIEKTTAGFSLIQKNKERFHVSNLVPIHGTSPEALHSLPQPDRIFIGGSGGYLPAILDTCADALNPNGIIVMAIATIENQTTVLQWIKTQNRTHQDLQTMDTQIVKQWHHRLLTIQLSRSNPIGSLTRLVPLNPVTLISLSYH